MLLNELRYRVSHTSTRVLGHDLGWTVQTYGASARCGEWLLIWGQLVGSEDFDRTVYISAGWFGSSLSAAVLGESGRWCL